MRRLGSPILLAMLAAGGCALFATQEQVECHDDYPDGGGIVVIDGQEEWLACFPDGGSIKCRSRYGVNPKDDWYPFTFTGEASTDVSPAPCPHG
jgi:hypothetical protein